MNRKSFYYLSIQLIPTDNAQKLASNTNMTLTKAKNGKTRKAKVTAQLPKKFGIDSALPDTHTKS